MPASSAIVRLLAVITVLVIPVLSGPAAVAAGGDRAGLAASAPAEPGHLEVTISPTTLNAAGRDATVRIANTGPANVTGLTVDAFAPPAGVSVRWPTLRGGKLPGLPPGASRLVPVIVDGFPAIAPAIVTVRVRGTSAGVPVTALASLSLAAASSPIKLALYGSNAMTDQSPAEVTATLINGSAARVIVRLTAIAGHHAVHIGTQNVGAAYCLDVPGQSATNVQLRVTAVNPVRRGIVALLVTAAVFGVRKGLVPGCASPSKRVAPSKPVATVTAAKDLSVDLAASDLLPSFLGITSMLFVPGLVAVWAWLAVRRRDEDALGLNTADPAKAMWDNKLWLLGAAGLSLLIAYLAALIGYVDLLDAYTWIQLVTVTAAAGGLAALASWLAIRAHRRRVPLVNGDSSERTVIRAALAGGSTLRPRYRSESGGSGLLVHEDRGVLVLAPLIVFARPSALLTAVQQGAEKTTILQYVANPAFNGRFVTDDGWIRRPGVFTRAQLTREPDAELLDYRDEG